MFVHRKSIIAAVVTFAAAAAVAGGYAASSTATIQAASSSALGTKIVVNSAGFTVYHLLSEKKGSIACTGACRKAWPPLLVSGSAKPSAGSGLSASKLGTIKRPDGGVQLTYNGYALYLYSADKKAGQVNGQGFDGSWYAITPSGTLTKEMAKTAVETSTTAPKTATTPAVAAPAPVATTPSAVPPSVPSGPATDNVDGCPTGTTIPQGATAGDADNDNTGGETDGDGCL